MVKRLADESEKMHKDVKSGYLNNYINYLKGRISGEELQDLLESEGFYITM